MDSFFGIGVFELVFIVIFALIFLGPERLPSLFRQIIGVIRQVRDLTADVTRQFNDEFGDIRELDPRHQIQKALNETTSEIKEATKPVTKTLNKPAPKPTPNAAAKPAAPKTTPVKATPKSTAAAATTDVAAAAEIGAESAEVVAAVGAANIGAQAASADSEADDAKKVTTNAESVHKTSPNTGEGTGSSVEDKPTSARPTPKQPSADDQISPASAHFAEKSSKTENGDKPKAVTAASEGDFTENTIAPPSADRQPQLKEAKSSESKPTDMPVVEPEAEPETEEESA